jgi:hypothetical protein
MTIETDSFFSDRINGILLTTSWVAAVKDQLGIQAASQIWSERPAWYLWLADEPGTYRLELIDADPGNGAGSGVSGIFAVKCYPFADHDVFPTFSAEERRYVQGPYLDATHTPGFDHRDSIPDELFNVAVIDYTADPTDRWACLTLESLSALRVLDREAGLRNHDRPPAMPFPKDDIVVRAVPGWRLGLPLFERLLGMMAFHRRRPPCRIRVTRSAGFHHVRNGSGDLVLDDAPDIHGYASSVLFGPPADDHSPGSAAAADPLESADDAEATEILFDETFPADWKPGPDSQPVAALAEIFAIRRRWWSLAEDEYRSELGSTCGCDGHHHCQADRGFPVR